MFILVENYTEQEYHQPYDYHDRGGYSPVTRTRVIEFLLEKDLLEYVKNYKATTGTTRKIFKAEELTIKTTISVELVKH